MGEIVVTGTLSSKTVWIASRIADCANTVFNRDVLRRSVIPIAGHQTVVGSSVDGTNRERQFKYRLSEKSVKKPPSKAPVLPMTAPSDPPENGESGLVERTLGVFFRP